MQMQHIFLDIITLDIKSALCYTSTQKGGYVVCIVVCKNGEIELPESIKEMYPHYISFFIRMGDIVVRIPSFDDNWEKLKDR